MSLLQENFNELVTRVRHGRDLEPTGFEPVYYLVFSPHEILDVKHLMPAWSAKLRNEGWDIHQFSISEAILDIIQQAPLRKIWLAADRKSPLAWGKTNQSLSNALANGALQQRLQARLEELNGKTNAMLLVTDLEGLHPYMRIGAIESQLSGKFHVPTVFFYPGKRSGKSRLSFLGFYPDDGNYRSVHVGG